MSRFGLGCAQRNHRVLEGEEGIIGRDRLRVRHIRASGCDLSRSWGLTERYFADDSAWGGGDKDDGELLDLELLLACQVASLLGEWHIESYRSRLSEQCFAIGET